MSFLFKKRNSKTKREFGSLRRRSSSGRRRSSLNFANGPLTTEDIDTKRLRCRLEEKVKNNNLKKGHFQLGATLGTGTFGRVRLVHYDEDKTCVDKKCDGFQRKTSDATSESEHKSDDPNEISGADQTNGVPKVKNGDSTNEIDIAINGVEVCEGSCGRKWILALKMLKKAEIIRLKQVAHIKSEKQILSKIRHPFIVDLYATFQDDRCIYMVMEYIIGGELFSQLRRAGRFSNDASRFFAAEIILALEYLHSQDIAYRDLKPENILIDKSGHIKITDFGFAKKVQERTWTLCGTPEYLAPEIIQSKGHGKAVDWWALGILIYEMLAGYPPFYDENPFGIYQKILSGRIEFPRHFDANAKDLVKRLLTPDRTRRLGCLAEGAIDVKRHRWFRHVNWEKVYHKKTRPPILPGFKTEDDTQNFDNYPSSDEEDAPPLRTKDAKQFEDF